MLSKSITKINDMKSWMFSSFFYVFKGWQQWHLKSTYQFFGLQFVPVSYKTLNIAC
jgi:hypothetical protein